MPSYDHGRNWRQRVEHMPEGPDKQWLCKFARTYLFDRDADAIEGQMQQLNAALDYNQRLLKSGIAPGRMGGAIREILRLHEMLERVIDRRNNLKEAAYYWGIRTFIDEQGREPEIASAYLPGDPIPSRQFSR